MQDEPIQESEVNPTLLEPDTVTPLWEEAGKRWAVMEQETPTRLATFRANKRRFERALYARYHNALDWYDRLLIFAQNIAAEFNTRHRPQAAQNKDVVFEVLTRIQARACMHASAIRALLWAGQGDDAMARWRTLFELQVVATLIEQQGDDLAERYLLYDTVQTLKNVRAYKQHGTDLGLTLEVSHEEVNVLVEEQDKLCQRFGKAFKNANGWAAGSLNKERPTISDLVRAANMSPESLYYALGSNPTHANVKGFGNGNQLVIGPNMHQLAAPANGAVVALVICTASVVRLRPDTDTPVILEILQRLASETNLAFLHVHTL